MTDEQLSSEVLLLDGFSERIIEIESIGDVSEYLAEPANNELVLYGKSRKE